METESMRSNVVDFEKKYLKKTPNELAEEACRLFCEHDRHIYALKMVEEIMKNNLLNAIDYDHLVGIFDGLKGIYKEPPHNSGKEDIGNKMVQVAHNILTTTTNGTNSLNLEYIYFLARNHASGQIFQYWLDDKLKIQQAIGNKELLGYLGLVDTKESNIINSNLDRLKIEKGDDDSPDDIFYSAIEKDDQTLMDKAFNNGSILAKFYTLCIRILTIETQESDEKISALLKEIATLNLDSNPKYRREKYLATLLCAEALSQVIKLPKVSKDFNLARELYYEVKYSCNNIDDTSMATIISSMAARGLENIEYAEQIEEKNKELNNIIAMFAHNFLGTLQCIRSNAEHDNNPNIHLKTVKMMGGALTAFSIISADDDKLVEQLKQDNTGESNLLQSLANNLALAISQLLSKTNKDKIINIYLNYLQKTGEIKPETNGEELRFNKDYRKKWQALQHQWEDEFNALFSEQVELNTLTKWINDNFFTIEIIGFDDYPIDFNEYGITDSIFLIVLMETLVNALKYMDVKANKPLTLKLCKQNNAYQLSCENPSQQESYRGTHKGMDFLQTIANKLNGEFISESTENTFKTTFSIPAQLLD